MDQSKKIVIDDLNGLTGYKFSDLANYAKSCFFNNQEYWPTSEQFGLDNSQYEALKLALTSKLALIQGYIKSFIIFNILNRSKSENYRHQIKTT